MEVIPGYVCVCACSVVSNSVIPWTVVGQALLSMEFSREEYWSGLPFPPPGNLPDPGIKLGSSVSSIGRWILYPCCHLGSPFMYIYLHIYMFDEIRRAVETYIFMFKCESESHLPDFKKPMMQSAQSSPSCRCYRFQPPNKQQLGKGQSS